MQDLNFETEATLFFGPPADGEQLQVRPDSRYFNRLADAVRFAIEEMPKDRRWGARIQSAHGIFDWEQIKSIHKQL